MIRKIYVITIKSIKFVLIKTKILNYVDKKIHNSFFLYIRSIFSIWDVEDMIKLDLPWWNISAINYVNNFLKKHNGNATVFEYGSGASTVWLSKRSKLVSFVEHDMVFYNYIKNIFKKINNIEGKLILPEINNNYTQNYCSNKKDYKSFHFKKYVKSIADFNGPFDLIVIDGRARGDCLLEAKKHLSKNGIIVFDNSLRKRYRKYIISSNLVEKKFYGLTACLPYPDQTSILSLKNS